MYPMKSKLVKIHVIRKETHHSVKMLQAKIKEKS